MFEIVIGEDEILRELEACMPWDIEALQIGWPYPQVAVLLSAHSFVIGGSGTVH